MNSIGFEFQESFIKLKSNWFDVDGKYSKMKYKAFAIYLNLFRFKLNVSEYEHYFSVCISDLRQVTGYSKTEVYEGIRLLNRLKVINILNVSRWDRFLDEKGDIPDYHMLRIAAIDVPDIESNQGDVIDPEHCCISVDLKLYSYYLSKGLNVKHYALYCLIKKLSNHGTERKAYMTIENMSERLCMDKTVLNRMIIEMNKAYVLYSRYTPNGKGGKNFEHHVLEKYSLLDKFVTQTKEHIDKNIEKWDKK